MSCHPPHVTIFAFAIPWPRRPASSSADNAMDALHTFWSSEGAAEDDKTTVQNIAMAAAATTSPLAPILFSLVSGAASLVGYVGGFFLQMRPQLRSAAARGRILVAEAQRPRRARREGLRWGRFRAHARPGVHRAARRAVARRGARGVPGGVSYTGRGGPFGSVECPRSPRRS